MKLIKITRSDSQEEFVLYISNDAGITWTKYNIYFYDCECESIWSFGNYVNTDIITDIAHLVNDENYRFAIPPMEKLD